MRFNIPKDSVSEHNPGKGLLTRRGYWEPPNEMNNSKRPGNDGVTKGQFTRCYFLQQLVGPTCSDNPVSLTQLTKVSAIFAFTRCDVSCLLQVVTLNRIV